MGAENVSLLNWNPQDIWLQNSSSSYQQIESESYKKFMGHLAVTASEKHLRVSALTYVSGMLRINYVLLKKRVFWDATLRRWAKSTKLWSSVS
jgi:hypothetical protein